MPRKPTWLDIVIDTSTGNRKDADIPKAWVVDKFTKLETSDGTPVLRMTAYARLPVPEAKQTPAWLTQAKESK